LSGYDRLIILNHRGNAKSDLGNKQGAIADYKQAAKLSQQQGNTELHRKALELT
jgi:hypothetical protein